MEDAIKEQIIFALEDDNEGMYVATEQDSDLDAENKEMNRDLIKEHEKILEKVNKEEDLNQEDLQLVKDANEMDMNDVSNVRKHHEQAKKLNEWLEEMMVRRDIFIKNVDIKLLRLQAEAILRCVEDTKEEEEKELLNGVWELLHNMLDEAEINGVVEEKNQMEELAKTILKRDRADDNNSTDDICDNARTLSQLILQKRVT